MSQLDLVRALRAAVFTVAVVTSVVAEAVVTDLSPLPLVSSADSTAKPNIMFILDDSASMGSLHMPDGLVAKKATVGYRNSSCNLVFYNPTTIYSVPLAGTPTPTFINPATASASWGNTPSTFASALDDGYYFFDGGGLTQIPLNSAFKSHFTDTAQAAYYWTYLGAGTLVPLNADCNMTLLNESDSTTTEICSDGTRVPTVANCTAHGGATWRKVLLTAGTADEQLNFANWYSYYRNRLNLMKSASGRAIVPLPGTYRLGFMTIDPGTPVAESKFEPMQLFTAANKALWTKKLYAQVVNDQTPLRTALSRAGRYYAGKTDGINQGMIGGNMAGPDNSPKLDPVEWSCQQNFTILTTDGYWSSAILAGVDGADTIGYNLAGTTLTTNQDGVLSELDAYSATPLPVSPYSIYDGAVRYSNKAATNAYRDNSACTYPQQQQRDIQYQTRTIQNQKKTVQNQTRTTQLQARTTQLQQLTIQNQQKTVQNQRRTIQNQSKTTQLQTRTTQLETRTTQRQKLTIQNQKKTIQNQKKTTQLQRRTTQLQKTSTQLQKQITQLQKRSIQNQSTTIQNQSKTTQLQKKTLQLQKKTARFRACSGTGGTGSCVDVAFDCSSSTGDGSKPYCYITNDSGWSNVSSATCPSASTETSTTVCQNTDLGWANAGTCTAAAINSSGQTFSCQTVDPGWVNVGTCVAAGINGSGATVTCQAGAAVLANVGACTASNPASGPTVTCQQLSDSGWGNSGTCVTATPAAGPAVTCQTITTQAFTNAGTCTGAAIDVNGVTVSCQTTAPATVNAGTCAVAAINGSGETITACPTTNPAFTNLSATSCTAVPINGSGATVECQTTNPAWVNIGTCVAAGTNGSGQTVTCQESSNTGWVNIGTCAASNPASGPTVTCQEASNTGWVDVGTCNNSNPAAGPTVTCQTTNPGWTPTAACTPAAINGSGATVYCQTTPGTWTDTGVCTPVPINGSGVTVECQTYDPGWVNIGTCVSAAINGTGATVSCQVASDSGWVNRGTCTGSNPAAGPTVTCQVFSDSGWVNIGTCAASNPTAGPTVTCQEASNSGLVNTGTCVASNPAAGPTVTCSTTNPAFVNAGTCSAAAINGSGQTVECNTITPAWATIATCTAVPINGTGATVQCQESSNTGWVNIGTCAASNPVGGPTVTCQVASDTGMQNSGTCAAATPAAGPAVTCNTTSDSGWYDVASCTAAPAASPAVTCQTLTLTGHQLQYRTTMTEEIWRRSGKTSTHYTPDPAPVVGAWDNYPASVCSAAVPAVPAGGAVTGLVSASNPTNVAGCSTWPCETVSPNNGSSNSLADVAQYYYKTDLRTGCAIEGSNTAETSGLCKNNVKPIEKNPTNLLKDNATWQHMTTFTLGLGVSGTLTFPDALTGLKDGTVDWPVPGTADDDPAKTDDLWHAALDGRGQYFSAKSPESIVSGLGDALLAIDAASASGTGAAVSNQEPVPGDNFAYVTTYLTKQWSGNIQALEINSQTGALATSPFWDAHLKMDNVLTKAACDNRTIKFFRPGTPPAAPTLVHFKASTDTCVGGVPAGSPVSVLTSSDPEWAYFDSTKIDLLYQSSLMTAAQKAAATPASLINFLRGQTGNENFTTVTTPSNDAKLYRTRNSVLGDIVTAAPKYVKAPFAGYDDAGYESFKTTNANRTPMVYVAANDGMLHAFYAGASTTDTQGGTEAWAVIPSSSLPNMFKLASANYSLEHDYLLDGTPAVSDVYDSTAPAWKTILVSGMRKGGKGYFALDVTTPTAPVALWEFKQSSTCFDSSSAVAQFTDCHIGYTYGTPIIAKLQPVAPATVGRWVVFLSSGYNNYNTAPLTGDGVGYLYVLDAITGQILNKISTGAGSAASPSGLAYINARSIETLRDNTVDFIYGTDLLGNIWRFDVNDLIAPDGIEASKIAQVVDSLGDPQPITTPPLLGVVNGDPYVYVATGKYLGDTDLKVDATSLVFQRQSVWAIKEPTDATTVASLRSALKTITTTTVGGETSTTAYRTNSCTNNCTSTAGWFTDWPLVGGLVSSERVNIDMRLDLGTLIVASNLPPSTACEVGGSSWLNFFDASSGLHVSNSANASTGSRVLNSAGELTQVVGLTIIRTTTGQLKVQATTREGGIANPYVAFSTPAPTGKRVSWREIVK